MEEGYEGIRIFQNLFLIDKRQGFLTAIRNVSISLVVHSFAQQRVSQVAPVAGDGWNSVVSIGEVRK